MKQQVFYYVSWRFATGGINADNSQRPNMNRSHIRFTIMLKKEPYPRYPKLLFKRPDQLFYCPAESFHIVNIRELAERIELSCPDFADPALAFSPT